MAWQDRIAIDPDVLVGKPVIKGTRIAVDFVVDLLAQGWTPEQVIDHYPSLVLDDIRAAGLFKEERTIHSAQAAKIRVLIDRRVRLEELICDGVLVCTPAGSTASASTATRRPARS